jgi:hypothetical protein
MKIQRRKMKNRERRKGKNGRKLIVVRFVPTRSDDYDSDPANLNFSNAIAELFSHFQNLIILGT